MFRRCPKAFHNNYNCINHIGVIYIYMSFIANILSETPTARNPHQIETDQQTCNANLLTGQSDLVLTGQSTDLGNFFCCYFFVSIR